MIILDENILEGQRLLLQAWRLPARQIGLDIGRKGLKDEEIFVLLKRQRNEPGMLAVLLVVHVCRE